MWVGFLLLLRRISDGQPILLRDVRFMVLLVVRLLVLPLVLSLLLLLGRVLLLLLFDLSCLSPANDLR